MKAKFKFVNPDAMDATMTITMTLGEWKRMRECIDDKWPGWDLRRAISDMVDAASMCFEHDGTGVQP